MRTTRVLCAALALLGALLAGGLMATFAAAESAPPGDGQIRVFLTPNRGENRGGKILITGVIADHGTYGPNLNSKGKPERNGSFGKITLTRGSFEVNLSALEAKAKKVKPVIDKQTCSFSFTLTAPVRLLHGRGRYLAIGGTVMLTERFGLLAPRYTSGPNKGQCDTSAKAKPVAEAGIIYGTGFISFEEFLG